MTGLLMHREMVHKSRHMRHAATLPPLVYAKHASIGGAPMPMDNAYPAIWRYDSSSYNWLADPYGAALNPTFWKIHSYVDDVIEYWLRANDFAMAAVVCRGQHACYQRRSQWKGDTGSGLATRGVPTVMPGAAFLQGPEDPQASTRVIPTPRRLTSPETEWLAKTSVSYRRPLRRAEDPPALSPRQHDLQRILLRT